MRQTTVTTEANKLEVKRALFAAGRLADGANFGLALTHRPMETVLLIDSKLNPKKLRNMARDQAAGHNARRTCGRLTFQDKTVTLLCETRVPRRIQKTCKILLEGVGLCGYKVEVFADGQDD